MRAIGICYLLTISAVYSTATVSSKIPCTYDSDCPEYTFCPDSLGIVDNTVEQSTFCTSPKDILMKPREDDQIQLDYGEHVLASWVLRKSPWTAFHSGLIFRNERTGETNVVEYVPRYTNNIVHVLLPKMGLLSGIIDATATGKEPTIYNFLNMLSHNWNELVSPDLVFRSYQWRNYGTVKWYGSPVAKYTNFTNIGYIDGKSFNALMDWTLEYNKTHNTFDPVEIVVEGQDPTTWVGSCMCHDLVSNALWFLYNFTGVEMVPEDTFFRDHIILFAKSYEMMDPGMKQVRAEIVEYFRLFLSFMGPISKKFTNIRALLVNAATYGLRPYVYIQEKYYRVTMKEPYVNYCYLPIAMPPKRANPFVDEKLCALEQTMSESSRATFVEAGKAMRDKLMTHPLAVLTIYAVLPVLSIFVVLWLLLWLMRRLCGRPVQKKQQDKSLPKTSKRSKSKKA